MSQKNINRPKELNLNNKMLSLPKKLILFVMLVLFKGLSQKMTCLNSQSEKVDWSIIYLLPKSGQSSDGQIKYAYIDESISNFEINDLDEATFPPNVIAKSLNNNDDSFILWNDGEEGKGDKQIGHTKGVLSFDNEGGIYMIHSLPRFPEINSENQISESMPSNTGVYGQTFFCISIPFSEVDQILKNLIVIDPKISLSRLNSDKDEIKELFQKISSNSNDKWESYSTSIKSSANQQFEIFVKPRKENVLPWDEAIPAFYKDNFYVETWTRPSLLPDVCDNAQSLFNIVKLNIGGISFHHGQDHSKWGVSEKNGIICYGDLNRTESQKKRGGLIACFKNTKVATLALSFITDHENCSNTLEFLS